MARAVSPRRSASSASWNRHGGSLGCSANTRRIAAAASALCPRWLNAEASRRHLCSRPPSSGVSATKPPMTVASRYRQAFRLCHNCCDWAYKTEAMGVINRSIKAAVRLYNEGMPDAAEEVCRAILKVEPGNAEVLHLLAQFDCRVGRMAQATPRARQAVPLDPQRANFLLTLGFATRAAAATAAAIACYRRAIVLDAEFAEAYLNLATLMPIPEAPPHPSSPRAIGL